MKHTQLFLAAATAALCGLAGTATAATVDGFDVAFNPLPYTANTTWLTPNNVALNAGPGSAGFTENASYPQNNSSPYTGWGATNPFTWKGTNGGMYDALWNGTATYDFSTPQNALSILWGSIDRSNQIEFFGQAGNLLGTINGADLIAAVEAAGGLPVAGYYGGNVTVDPLFYFSGVEFTADITVQVPSDFYSFETIGGSDLTFEYTNILPNAAPQTGPVSAPDTASSLLLLATGLAALVLISARNRTILAAARRN